MNCRRFLKLETAEKATKESPLGNKTLKNFPDELHARRPGLKQSLMFDGKSLKKDNIKCLGKGGNKERKEAREAFCSDTEPHKKFEVKRLVVSLVDVKRVASKYLRQVDELTFYLNSETEMMTMKTVNQKTNTTKSPVKASQNSVSEKSSLIAASETDEDNLSLKELKSLMPTLSKTKLEEMQASDKVKGDQTPKRGRKSTSTENSPNKSESGEKKSPGKKGRKSSPGVSKQETVAEKSELSKEKLDDKESAASSAPSPAKKKNSASPRRRKKDEAECPASETPEKTSKQKKRSASESPSPCRKSTPKKSPADSPKKKDSPDKNKDVSVKSCSKSEGKKSPKKKGEQLQDASNKKSPASPKKSQGAKSPKGGGRKGSESVEKLSPGSKGRASRSKADSTSPKGKGRLQKNCNQGTTNGAVKALDFFDISEGDVKQKILQSAKGNFPKDFKYQYNSGTISSTFGLDNLISKVNKALEVKDENLTVLFGSVEEPVSSPETSEISEIQDSDKSVAEIDTSISTRDGETVEKNSENVFDVKATNLESETSKVDDDVAKTESKNNEINEGKETSSSRTEQAENVSSDSSSNIDQMPCGEKESESAVTMETDNFVKGDIEKPDENYDDDNKLDKNGGNLETINVFDMFGLTLKKLDRAIKTDPEIKIKPSEKSANTEGTPCVLGEKSGEVTSNEDKGESVKMNVDSDDDVIIVSERKAEESIVISDDEEDAKCIDRSGYEVLNESINSNRCKPKFTTVNNVVEPKPLEILTHLEKTSGKESAFCCSELEEYLEANKENQGEEKLSLKHEHSKVDIKKELEKAEADIDDINGVVFVSFASENAMKAHESLEKKVEWITESQLKKLAQLKLMKERQLDAGSKRMTDVKSLEEQKQNFRGVPMRMVKYQKLLKQELENILLCKPTSPEKAQNKTPQKTADITKIKGWKNKFQNAEELQEVTGINISESGKIHWKTEERLLKNLDPEDVKDMGLDLKKKRRKIVSYTTNKRKGVKDSRDEYGKDFVDYEYEIDESVVTERDVYNEEDEKPPLDKIPYSVKYLSQHKYGARKMFVKKMKLDAEDERILKKLGTQKMFLTKEEEEKNATRSRKIKLTGLEKLTQSMALAAVSALNKKLISKAKKLSKVT